MKNKKVLIGLVICFVVMGLLSSCAIDRKCPAYTKAETPVAPVTIG